jgi:hypothetical protein
MRAFVEHGSQQLTRQLNPVTKKTQISRFFYYSTRGAGIRLRSARTRHAAEKRVVPKHPLRPNHPRSHLWHLCEKDAKELTTGERNPREALVFFWV